MTELSHPKEYNGLDGLEPREDAVIGVLGLGLKKQVLENWIRDHPDWKPPENAVANGRLKPVPMTDRFFIRVSKGQGAPGSQIIDRYRPMLGGFEMFNLGENEQGVLGPAGKTSFYGFLPAGDPDDYLQVKRQAQKLGKMVKVRGKTWPEFQRAPDTEPAPGNQAECRGDGKKASRWMKAGNQFGWHEIDCLNHNCPFADVCPPKTNLLVHSQADKCGESLVLRYESPTSIHTAQNLTGFFDRIKRELDNFELSHELYGLPIRMEVEMQTKGAGAIMVGGRSKQMPSRRFPVVKISERMNVVQFREGLAARLEAGRGALALPAAPLRITTPAEEVDSAADFTVEPSVKPRLELVPADHALKEDVVEAEVVDDSLDKYPGASLIEKFLGYMPRKKSASEEATRLLLQASCIKKGEKWYNLDPKAPREIWTAALHALKKSR